MPGPLDRWTAHWQKLAMAAVLVVAAIFAVVTLSASKPRLAGNNGVSTDVFVAVIDLDGKSLCTRGVTLPTDATGVRMFVGTYRRLGVQMKMTVRDAAGRLLAVSTPPRFDDGARVTFAVPNERPSALDLCFVTDGSKVAVAGNANGNANPAQTSWLDKRPAKGDVSLEYMRAGTSSGWSMIPTAFSRASLFRPSWVGPWTFYLGALLALAMIAAGWALLLRAGRLQAPAGRRAFLAVAVIVFINASIWAVVTPAFNTPDELAHFTYVETLAAGELPQRSLGKNDPGNSYLPSTVYAASLTAQNVIGHPFVKPPWIKADERTFEETYAGVESGPNARYGLTPSSVYSPAYYGPALVPWAVGGIGNVFDRLFLIRLYSALLLAIGVIFAMLFVREMLPRQPWAPIVAGLALGFEPMVAHIGGGASNDNLMIAACAATLWAGARVMRRGPTFWNVFAATGAFVIAVAAKPTSLGLVFALAFAVLIAIVRSERRFAALRTSVLGAAIPFVMVAILFATFGNDGGTAPVAGAEALRPATVTGYLSYLWQWYLPSIGGMDEYFVGTPPAFKIFFGGFLADFNALDTRFGDDFYKLAALAALALFVLVLRALWLRRDRLRSAWPIVAYPVLAVLGTALAVNTTGYFVFIKDGQLFAQGRYLFPALAVFGLYVAAAAVGAGRRYALPLASAVVMALAVVNFAGMAISLERFYL
jgi:hypothetical protein